MVDGLEAQAQNSSKVSKDASKLGLRSGDHRLARLLPSLTCCDLLERATSRGQMLCRRLVCVTCAGGNGPIGFGRSTSRRPEELDPAAFARAPGCIAKPIHARSESLRRGGKDGVARMCDVAQRASLLSYTAGRQPAGRSALMRPTTKFPGRPAPDFRSADQAYGRAHCGVFRLDSGC